MDFAKCIPILVAGELPGRVTHGVVGVLAQASVVLTGDPELLSQFLAKALSSTTPTTPIGLPAAGGSNFLAKTSGRSASFPW